MHVQKFELCFLKDIQLMSLQRVVLDNFPFQSMPLLAQNPDWAVLDIFINPMPFGYQMPVTKSCVPPATADIVTSLHLQNIDTNRLDLSEFHKFSRLKALTFELWSHSEFFQDVQLFNLANIMLHSKVFEL